MSELKKGDEQKTLGMSIRLCLYAVLLLFNIYHVATEQIAKANKEEIESLRLEFSKLRGEFSELRQEFVDQAVRREKAKSDFDLFFEHYEKSKN